MSRDPQNAAHARGSLSLSLPVAEIATEIERKERAEKPEDPELALLADEFVADVLNVNETDATDTNRKRQAVDAMGLEVQRQAAHRSAVLRAPIRRLAAQGGDGGFVAEALLDLRGRMKGLDPHGRKLSDGPLARTLSFIPGARNRLQRYFHRFERAQQGLDGIIHDLASAKDMLRRDNLTLADDQAALRSSLHQLTREIALGRLVDRRLEAAVTELGKASLSRAFVEEELLLPLRQRIVDLQQQLAVSQQGVLALEVVIRNNRELMRGVDRAVNVTVSALNVAMTTALALANQRLVLNGIEALNTATSDVIAGAAQQVRSRGMDIRTRRASAMLGMERLEQAFTDVIATIDEVSRYRREARPGLDAQINRLGKSAPPAMADRD